MKKILMIDLIIISAVLLISFLIASLSDFLLTDIIFIGSMLTLAVAVILMISARKDMKAEIKLIKKSEKSDAIKVFRWSEKLAMSLVIVTSILFAVSFGLA